MYRKKHLFLLALILFASHVKAWDEPPLLKNQLKFSPLRLLDIYNPGLELSYERIFEKRYSTQLSVTYLNDGLFLNVTGISTYQDFKGLRISLEEKYFIKPYKYFKKYFSGEFIFYQANIHDIMSFGSESTYYYDSLAYKDSITINKKMLTFNVKFGVQLQVKHFILELSGGIGIKYKDIRHVERLNPDDYMQRPRHLTGDASALEEGNRYAVNFPLNIKLGYLF